MRERSTAEAGVRKTTCAILEKTETSDRVAQNMDGVEKSNIHRPTAARTHNRQTCRCPNNHIVSQNVVQDHVSVGAARPVIPHNAVPTVGPRACLSTALPPDRGVQSFPSA